MFGYVTVFKFDWLYKIELERRCREFFAQFKTSTRVCHVGRAMLKPDQPTVSGSWDGRWG